MRALLVLILCAGCTSASSDEAAMCSTPADTTAPADVTLTSADTMLEPDGNTPFEAWSFDGDVPGPILRMSLGQTLRVKLVNHSPRPESLHFHGVVYAASDDGSEDVVESVVQPGCAHVYTVTAVVPGVWPYHSHVDTRNQMARGLYGAVVIPSPGEPAAAHEYVALFSTMGLEQEGEASGHWEVINGRADGLAEVLEWDGTGYARRMGFASARVGELVRWRVVNLSPDDFHTFHLHGHRWCAGGGVPANGACPSGELPADNVALTPATGLSLEILEDNPGHWMLHCHVEDHFDDGMYTFYDAAP